MYLRSMEFINGPGNIDTKLLAAFGHNIKNITKEASWAKKSSSSVASRAG